MNISKVFNEHLLEFLDDVISILPDNLDIKTAKSFVEGLKKVNPKKIIISWYSYITVPYKSIIEAGDYDFFEKKNYDNEVYSEYIKAVDNIKKSVKLLDKENKKKAMKYVQNLTKLSLLYNK
mgnify:FL=1|tara:strand:+ start:773 stop:1138 length:366 start_codon:yes stop_codon:yes gene_type:complete